MKVVGRSVLDVFCAKHVDARRWIENWLSDTEEAAWANPQDIKDRYSSASFLVGNTVIFNVKGNEYRLETTCAFRTGVIVVEWIGTHAEYNVRNRKR